MTALLELRSGFLSLHSISFTLRLFRFCPYKLVKLWKHAVLLSCVDLSQRAITHSIIKKPLCLCSLHIVLLDLSDLVCAQFSIIIVLQIAGAK